MDAMMFKTLQTEVGEPICYNRREVIHMEQFARKCALRILDSFNIIIDIKTICDTGTKQECNFRVKVERK